LMLQNGLNVVLAGAPNSGKSTLINNLAADDVAIVTPLAGTTRDKLQANILLHGLPLQITDTAGLRDTTEIIEQEGIIRSEKAMQAADLIIWLCNLDLDSFEMSDQKTTFNNEGINALLEIDWERFVSWRQKLQCEDVPVFYVANKSDLHNDEVKSFIKNKLQGLSITDELRWEVKSKRSKIKTLLLSAKNNDGVFSLEKSLVEFSGVATVDATGGSMSARKRHVDALKNALARLNAASAFYTQKNTSLEIIAEEMRLAQISLSELTGEHTSDDLLGEIFSSFCVGK
jgi:tRNA modification GTPase